MTITVKVTVESGNHWLTGINTDLAGAKRYFLGESFDMGDPDGPEKMERVISVALA